ncbi:MAG: FAD-dependent oxidoreductase [Phycisphaeraceae bacterium]
MNQQGHGKLRIVIVGGVAGGASAATRARRLNARARITLFEKDAHISFANCGLPYYIGGEITERGKLLVASPELFEQRFGIEVRTRQEVIAIDRQRQVVQVLNHTTGERYEQAYDKLILAPGASPIVPHMPGVDAPNVFTLRNLADTDAITHWIDEHPPRRAVVVGAGFIGLEMVEQLLRRGMQVSLVELQDQVLPPLDREMAQPLREQLACQGVELHLGQGIEGLTVERGRAVAVRIGDGQTVPADLVLLGLGVRPNTGLARDAGLAIGPQGGIVVDEHLRTSDPAIYAVGDAVEYRFGPTDQPMRIPLAGPANRAGRLAGEHAATGRGAPMGPVMGTAVVRVFDQTAASTGLSIKLARRLGIDATSVTILANHHAGYYPGAESMTLKLIYAPDTGRILGAQAVGRAGVDKRIDVIATAMRFGGTVRDLADVDLAYAPPYGSAKDPVHMAAFAASNQLDGLVDFIQPDEDLSQLQVLDVRTAREVADAPLADVDRVVHIPLDELRKRLDELDPTSPTVTLCASGVRSYAAARLLREHGFAAVRSLSGGQIMRRRALASHPDAQSMTGRPRSGVRLGLNE